MADAMNGLFGAFLSWLYATGGISIPKNYHEQCAGVSNMLANDITGTINTVINYAINSASETIYSVESSNETIEKLLNLWLSQINLMINGIPTGIHELTKEYYKERWSSSSLCLLQVGQWKNITVDQTTISVPTTLWFANGSSIYVERDDKNFKLGSDKYYLDSSLKKQLPIGKNEEIVVEKPFSRWFDKYPTPYLVKTGVLKNFLGIQAIQSKSDEVITKVLPYLFTITKGTERLFVDGKVDYKPAELTELVDKFKEAMKGYNAQGGDVPVNGIPFDQKYEHIIPDLTKILSEELYRQGYRALLCGLGFIDVLQGVSSSIDENEFVLAKIDNKTDLVRVKNLSQYLDIKNRLEVPTFKDGYCEWKKATIWKHPYTGKMCKIISDDGQYQVKTTPNHSIMIWDKEEGLITKRADELKQNDLMVILNNFNLDNKNNKKLVYYDYLGSNRTHKVKNKKEFEVNKDMGYFLGWYVAEGVSTKYNIILYVGTDKSEAERVLLAGENGFGIKGSLEEREDLIYYKNKTLYIVKFSRKGIAELFTKICNKGAHNKRIPQVIFDSPREVQLEFLRGLLEGDGHCYKRDGTWSLTTVSEELAYGTMTLMRMLGLYPHLQIQNRIFKSTKLIKKSFKGRVFIVHEAKQEGIPTELIPSLEHTRGYVTNISEIDKIVNELPKDWSLKRVSRIEQYTYSGEVYDLEVPDNETFVAGTNVLVHNTRKESVLNPKPFIAEVNAGVDGFKTVLLEVINLIIIRNKESHKKLFSENNNLKITNSPLKINVETLLDSIQSGFIYGVVSYETYQETLGLDPSKELQRIKKEWNEGLREIYYPRIIQNQEATPDTNVKSAPITKKQIEKTNEKNNFPKNMTKKVKKASEEEIVEDASIKDDLEEAPYDKLSDLPKAVQKMPKKAQQIWKSTFNQVLEDNPGDEAKAFRTSWSAANKWLKDNGYKKVEDKWVKE